MNIEKIHAAVDIKNYNKNNKEQFEKIKSIKGDEFEKYFKTNVEIDKNALNILFTEDSGGISAEEFLKILLELEK